MKYSLSDKFLTISLSGILAQELQLKDNEITVGGEGSYLDNFDFAYNSKQWTTKGDATGSYTHEESKDRTGTCSITLNQLSQKVQLFKRICNIYYNTDKDLEGMTIVLTTRDGTQLARCTDCMLNIPNQSFSSESATQTWEFTCGRIEHY